MSENKILEASYEILSYYNSIRENKFLSLELETVKKVLNESFHHFEKALINYDGHMVLDAKYALAAYLDEMIIYSEWDNKQEWLKEPLQVILFNEHLAGENFYKRLDKLQEYPQKNIELLELYYVCLQLGFKGKYRITAPEQLMGRLADLRNQIELVRGVPLQTLSEPVLIEQNVKRKFYQRKPFWIFVSATFMIIVFYIYCLFSINHYTDIAISKINSNAMAIQQTLHSDNGREKI